MVLTAVKNTFTKYSVIIYNTALASKPSTINIDKRNYQKFEPLAYTQLMNSEMATAISCP